MSNIVLTDLGIAVVTDRIWGSALVPRNGGGWNFIGQYYNTAAVNPTESAVLQLEAGTYHIDTETPYAPGALGITMNENFTYANQLRAPNGRVFFPAYSGYWYYYEPTTEHVIKQPRIASNVGLLYSAIFNHDGSTLYFGSLGTSLTNKLPWLVKLDPVTLTISTVCLVGSSGHTLNAYAYYTRADNDPQEEWVYVIVGEDIWDVVAVNVATKTQTVIATATTNAFASFEIKPEGWTVKLYTNYGQPTQTLNQFWLVRGVQYPYVPGYDPATLPFTPRNVTPYVNALVNPPSLDLSLGAQHLLWRPFGSTGPYTQNDFTLQYTQPAAIQSVQAMPDGEIFGDVAGYQGFWSFDPTADAFTYYGPFQGVTEGNARRFVESSGKYYISGYPNAPLYRYDYKKAVSYPVGVNQNPKYLGQYSDGVTLSGIKRATCLSWSEVQKRVYAAGLRNRNGTGAGVGWYDEDTLSFGGNDLNLLGYTVAPQILAMDTAAAGAGRVVMGSQDNAQLVVYDTDLTEINRQTPNVGVNDTGYLFGTNEANIVVGVSGGGQIVYRYNIATQTLLASVSFAGMGALKADAGAIVQNSGTYVITTIIGTSLVTIDPFTLAITTLGTLDQTIFRLSYQGANLYAAGGASVANLLVDQAVPVDVTISAAAGAFHLAGGAVTTAQGTAGHISAGAGAFVLTGGRIDVSAQISFSMQAGFFFVTGSDISVSGPPPGTLYFQLPNTLSPGMAPTINTDSNPNIVILPKRPV